MPTLAAALKSEVRRLTAKQIKKALRPLIKVRRQVKALRLAARGQRRTLASVERRFDRFKARAAARAGAVPGRGRARQLAPQTIRSLRARLGMTRVRFAKLVGVSPGSIFGWETGRTTPRGKSTARLLDVKKMGVRQVRARAKTPGGARRRGRRGRRAKR